MKLVYMPTTCLQSYNLTDLQMIEMMLTEKVKRLEIEMVSYPFPNWLSRYDGLGRCGEIELKYEENEENEHLEHCKSWTSTRGWDVLVTYFYGTVVKSVVLSRPPSPKRKRRYAVDGHLELRRSKRLVDDFFKKIKFNLVSFIKNVTTDLKLKTKFNCKLHQDKILDQFAHKDL